MKDARLKGMMDRGIDAFQIPLLSLKVHKHVRISISKFTAFSFSEKVKEQ